MAIADDSSSSVLQYFGAESENEHTDDDDDEDDDDDGDYGSEITAASLQRVGVDDSRHKVEKSVSSLKEDDNI
jgi:hypothetical protein